MSYLVIVVFVAIFATNWFRLRKGAKANVLYEALNIEPVFVKKYMEAYDSVSGRISKPDYIERAEGLHSDFRYDIVRYMDNEYPAHKLKAVMSGVKSKGSLPFEELPEEIQLKANKCADDLVATLLKIVTPTFKSSDTPSRRRR